MMKCTCSGSVTATLSGFVLVALSACGGPSSDSATRTVDSESLAVVGARIDELAKAVDEWQNADDLPDAQAAAERARALVTGPGVTGYDADTVAEGLLPGEHGESGLAIVLAGCAGPDLLGGSWADPAARWDEWRTKVAGWTLMNNTFPQLASHPQRVAGWSELALDATDLAEAHEYAGHAQLHVTATVAAAEECGDLSSP